MALLPVQVKHTQNIHLYKTQTICELLDAKLLSICQDIKISETFGEDAGNVGQYYMLSKRLQNHECTDVISLRDCAYITSAHILLIMLKYPNAAGIHLYITSDDLTFRIKQNSVPCYIETHYKGTIEQVDNNLPTNYDESISRYLNFGIDPNAIEVSIHDALTGFEHYVDARHILDVKKYERKKENKQFFCEVCKKSLSIVEKELTNIRSLDELISMESVCLQCELKKEGSTS